MDNVIELIKNSIYAEDLEAYLAWCEHTNTEVCNESFQDFVMIYGL